LLAIRPTPSARGGRLRGRHRAAFDDVFRQASGRILIGTFASLISRIQLAARAAAAHDRVLALVGTSMVDNVRIARQLGYLETPDDLIVPLDQALKMKPERIALMCTGTQGEPSSILGRLSTGTNRQFDLIPGDTVVLSSHPIPGNEEMVHRTINRLLHRGATVIYDAIAPVHVSGHASRRSKSSCCSWCGRSTSCRSTANCAT
jgi:ribonuclease J